MGYAKANERRSLKIISFIALCIFNISNSSLDAQNYILGNDLLESKSQIDIPFDYVGGFIVVDVKFNNIIPLKFIYDTGAANTILFDKYYAEIFGEIYSDTIKILGADITLGLDGYIVRNGSFRINDSASPAIRDYITLSEDYIKLQESVGVKIGGILGSDFFKRLTVQIDYRRQVLRLFHPDKFRPNKKWTAMPIEIIKGKPYINCQVNLGNKTTKIKMLLDTGASISSIIHTNVDNDIQLPENSIVGYLGKGLSGNILGHIGSVEKLTLGAFSFNNIIANFQDIDVDSIGLLKIEREGIIGNTILSRFHIAIDYIRNILYLKPNSNYDEEFKVDRSGLILHAFGENLSQFLIHYVYPESPAYQAGLRKGDIIVKLGRCKTKNYNLDKINRKFRGKIGKKYKITYLRNEEIFETYLTLKSLLPKN